MTISCVCCHGTLDDNGDCPVCDANPPADEICPACKRWCWPAVNCRTSGPNKGKAYRYCPECKYEEEDV